VKATGKWERGWCEKTMMVFYLFMKREWVKKGAVGSVLLLRCSCLGDREGAVDNGEGGTVVNAFDMGMELTIPKSLNFDCVFN
jgi:hypothetical protein